MKTKHDFQLEFESQLAQIEDEIDEWRRERRKERARSQRTAPPRASKPLILPDDD